MAEKCLNCEEDFNPKKYGRKERMARKLVLSEISISIMGVNFSNPFFMMLPDDPGKWCNKCLREYLNLDSFELDWRTGGLKVKERVKDELSNTKAE